MNLLKIICAILTQIDFALGCNNHHTRITTTFRPPVSIPVINVFISSSANETDGYRLGQNVTFTCEAFNTSRYDSVMYFVINGTQCEKMENPMLKLLDDKFVLLKNKTIQQEDNNTNIYCQVKSGTEVIKSSNIITLLVLDNPDEYITTESTTEGINETTLNPQSVTDGEPLLDADPYVVDSNSPKMPMLLIYGLVFLAILVIVGVLLVVLAIRRHRKIINNELTRGNELTYANLDFPSSQTDGPRPVEDTPYAEIIGVLKHKK